MAPPTLKQIDSQRQMGFKRLKTLQGLAKAELILALKIVVSLIASVVLAATSHAIFALSEFAIFGFTFGLLGIVSGGLGVGAFRARGQNRKCLFIAHFVMCIISAVVGFLTVLLGIANVVLLHMVLSSPRVFSYRSPIRVLVALWIVLLASLAHVVCSIISTALTCNNWCRRTVEDTSVLYVPNLITDATVSLGNRSIEPTLNTVKAQDV